MYLFPGSFQTFTEFPISAYLHHLLSARNEHAHTILKATARRNSCGFFLVASALGPNQSEIAPYRSCLCVTFVKVIDMSAEDQPRMVGSFLISHLNFRGQQQCGTLGIRFKQFLKQSLRTQTFNFAAHIQWQPSCWFLGRNGRVSGRLLGPVRCCK